MVKMKIEILGSGCIRCKAVYENTKKAVSELGIDADIQKVEDINEIINRGIMMTPAISIDGKIMASGRIPSKDEIKKWITDRK